MDYFRDRKVVVCGGAGFVGGYLVEQLVSIGAEVFVLDDLSRGTRVHPETGFASMDVTDVEDCMYFFDGAFAVFNLAAKVAGVLHNESHHLSMYKGNVDLLTAPVIAADSVGVPNFLQVSTVCVYSPENNHPSVEELGMDGEPHPANAGYAESKRDGERLLGWANNIDKRVIVRPSNIFGPWDYFDDKAHVIAALIKKALSDDESIVVYGPPETVREFIYVEDAASGMIHALASGEPDGIYNLGTGGDNTVTIATLVDMVQEACDTNKPVEWRTGRGGGDPLRWSSAYRINSLGWRHTVDLADGLERTVDWYVGQIQDSRNNF